MVFFSVFKDKPITDEAHPALTEGELGELAEFIEPNNQERFAQILHPEEGSMITAFLRAQHREDIWGVGNDILQKWLNKNPPPGNRLVSIHKLKIVFHVHTIG